MRKMLLLYFFIFSSIVSFGQIPFDGLVAYYPFNGNANDESGNGNDGIVNGGVSFVADRFGRTNKCILLDGIDDYVNVPNSESFTFGSNSFSISFWVKPEEDSPGTLVSKFDETSGWDKRWSSNWSNIYKKFEIHWSNEIVLDNNLATSSTFDPQHWYHLVFVVDRNLTTVKIYVDNLLSSSTSSNINGTFDNDQPLTFGRINFYNNAFFKGLIDDIRIYNSALTEDEISDLYNESPYDGLVAYYPFNGNANDESGNGLNLTIEGNPTLVSDRHGNLNSAYQFDGMEDYLFHDRNELLIPLDKFTLNVWINNAGLDGEEDVIISTLDLPDIGGYQIYLSNNDDMIRFSVRDPDDYSVTNPYEDAYINDWVMITAIYDKNIGIKLFINGELKSELEGIIQINYAGTNNFRVGTNPHADLSNPADRRFKGKIDDVRIYDRALNDSEILDLYHENGWIGKKIPLIFIPGIMGSALYNDLNDDNQLTDEERIWIKMFSNMEVLKLAENGIDPFNNNDSIKVAPIRGDNTRTIRDELDSGILKNKPLNVYSGLVQFLESDENGYRLDDDTTTSASKNLFIFIYDWRKSINYNSSLLSEYVQNVKNWTNSQQVNLLCHSLGGLIAKDLINNLGGNSNIIRKIIFVGTPHLGSPKALYVTLSGDPVFPITIYTTTQILRASRNFPSGYSLFPSESYYELNIDNGHSSNVNSYSYTFQKNDEQPMSYSSIKTFFKDVTVHHAIGEDYTFNDYSVPL